MNGQKTEFYILPILVAGALATLASDSFGQAISPLLGFPGISPVPLATQTIQVLTGIQSPELGHLLHVITGLIFYPLGWYLLARPIQQKIVPDLPWMATAIVYAVVLWIFAIYIVSHLIAGNPPFLGWTGITWVALASHTVYAVTAAWAMERRDAILLR